MSPITLDKIVIYESRDLSHWADIPPKLDLAGATTNDY